MNWLYIYFLIECEHKVGVNANPRVDTKLNTSTNLEVSTRPKEKKTYLSSLTQLCLLPAALRGGGGRHLYRTSESSQGQGGRSPLSTAERRISIAQPPPLLLKVKRRGRGMRF